MTAVSAISAGRIEAGVLLTGLATASACIGFLPGEASINVAITIAIGILVVWIVWQDIRLLTISDAAIFAIAMLALASRWQSSRVAHEPVSQMLLDVGIDIALSGGSLLLFREIFYRRKGYDGLGLGDVKLAAAGGILVGAVGFSWALFVASLAALVFVALSRFVRRPFVASDKIAFGALFAPVLWAVWVGEQTPALLALTHR